MATTTTNFGLKKYEGTDLFNPLTFENPNTDDIDTAMFYNKQHNCVDATELTTGTVHAITKTDLDSPLFSFSATSVYHYGDTFTLNGTPITALLTSGEVLPEGAYVIGSRVMGFVSGGGSLITFYVMKTTDLTPINNIIGNTDISGIADGTLTGAVDMLNTDLSQLITPVQISTGDANIIAWKSGHVASIIFRNTVTAAADVPFANFPNSLRPNDVTEFRDTYGNKRIQVSTGGAVSCTEALSNQAIRGTLTYVTRD